VDDQTHFRVGDFSLGLIFEPKQVAKQLTQPLRVISPDGLEVGAGQLLLQGQGTPRFSLFYNSAQLLSVLRAIAEGRDGDKVDYSQITPAERALIDTDAKRAQIVGEIQRLAEAMFTEFSAGLEFMENSGPNAINVSWGYDALGGFGVAPNGVDEDSMIGQALAEYKLLNRPAQNYAVARGLNNRFAEQVLIAVDDVLGTRGGRFSLPLEMDRLEFINLMVKVLVHEAGHTLGGVHTSIMDRQSGDIRLSIGGVDGFSDIMSSAFFLDAPQSFQPNFSRELLKMGTKIDWTLLEGQAALRLLLESLAFQAFEPIRPQSLASRSHNIDDTPDLDGDNSGHLSPIPGPRLALYDAGSNLVSAVPLAFAAVLNDRTPTTNTFSLFNYGTQAVAIDDITERDASSVFELTGLAPGDRIAPKERKQFHVTFKPLASGESDGTIEIFSTDDTGPVRLNLRGEATVRGPDLRVSVGNHNLGGTALRKALEVQDWASVRNAGTEPLEIRSIVINPEGGATGFALLGLPPALAAGQPVTLAPGQSLKFGVAFNPQRTGLQRESIIFQLRLGL
jgi:hypothetical protein